MAAKPLQSMSLKIRLALFTGIIVFLTIAVLTAFFIASNRKMAIDSSKTRIKLRAMNSANAIRYKVDETMIQMFDLAEFSKMSRSFAINKREQITSFLKKELEKNQSLHGITLTYLPDRFDQLDAEYANKPGYYTDGRFNVYWYREEGEIMYYTDVVNFDEELASAGGDWWIVPKETKGTYMSITEYTVGGKDVLILSLSIPIIDDGDFIGVVCFDYQSDFMQQEALQIKESLFAGKSEISIISDNGLIAAHTAVDTLINKNVNDVYNEKAKTFFSNSINEFSLQNDTLILNLEIKYTSYDKPWIMHVEIPMQVILADVNKKLLYNLFIGILILVLSIVTVILIVSRLISPLIKLKEATEVLATGDLKVSIKTGANDEIGSLANSFKLLVTKLNEIVSGIWDGAYQITAGSQQVSNSAQVISQGANEQASATEQVASSIEEIITAINQNAENAQTAKQIASKAEQGIIDSQQVSLKTIEAMQKIAEITNTVTLIAKQTNILAVNAAIEAARAGNLGKGFGIVAEEVRKLAERSNQAAIEIVALSDQTLKMSEKSGQILNVIVPDVRRTKEIVDEISIASLEQNSGLKQISMAVEQMNLVTLQNSSTSEELASSSEELVAQIESLKKAIEFFKIESNINVQPVEIEPDYEKPPFEIESLNAKTEFNESNNNLFVREDKGFNLKLDTEHDDEFEKF